MGIIIILFVCVYSDCPPRRRNEQGQVRWGNISRLHGGTGRKKLKRRRKKDRERILLDKKKRRKNEEGEGKRKGKQENISHLTPTVTTSASHSGFNVLWAKPPHPVHALFALTLSLSLSLSLSHSLLPLSVHQPRAGWIRQASTREGGYIPLYRSCLFTMRRVYPS